MPGRERDWQLGSRGWLAENAGMPARPVLFPAQTGTFTVFNGRCIYFRTVGTNSATTAGTLLVYDGTNATGPLIDGQAVAASAPFVTTPLSYGILCDSGVTLVFTTSTVEGSVLLVPMWDYPFTPQSY